MEFHDTQIEAIDFLIESIKNNVKVSALIGAGGTGKSEILSIFESAYSNSVKPYSAKSLFFSATTNKAVSRLLEVLEEAKTVHSLTAIPKYTPLYNELEDFYSCFNNEKDKEKYIEEYKFIESKQFIKDYNINLLNHNSIGDVLAFTRLTPFSKLMFEKYIIQDYIPNSVIIIDEASMLPNKSLFDNKGSLITIGLDVVKKVFQNVILVGDNAQLPPINGKSSFIDIPSYELTINFRSEKDLLKAIEYARDGEDFSYFKSDSPNVKIVSGISEKWYKATCDRTDVVHIVFRNATRHAVTKRIRGNRGNKPLQGEPILLRARGNDKVSKGEIGIFDNGYIEFEKGEMELKHYHNFDEYETERYAGFQFGYAITAHSAQGSSFHNVIVHMYDIPHFIDKITRRQWIYTAVSRARKSLTIIV